MKRIKWLALPVVLIVYFFSYTATKSLDSDSDCERFTAFKLAVESNRNYVAVVNEWGITRPIDSVLILVNPNVSVNWNLFADTVCSYSTSAGFPHMQVFVLKTAPSYDTLASRQCP